MHSQRVKQEVERIQRGLKPRCPHWLLAVCHGFNALEHLHSEPGCRRLRSTLCALEAWILSELLVEVACLQSQRATYTA